MKPLPHDFLSQDTRYHAKPYPAALELVLVHDLPHRQEQIEYIGKVRHIDTVDRTVVFLAANGRSAGKTIKIDDIKEIHGELVDYMDEV